MKRLPLILLLAACSHSRTTSDSPKAAAEKKAEGTDEKPKASATTHATSTTTKEMFKKDGLKKLQSALANKGNANVKETGVLDARTQTALKAYQKQEGIAETGMPDYEVVRRLGLEPDEVFHSKPPAKRIGVK